MFKKIMGFFESIPATVISGIFLLGDFIPHLTEKIGGALPFKTSFHPAIVTIIISGTPILYSSIKKFIKNRGISRISSALLISIAMIAAIIIGDIFAAGEVAFIMAIGEILEELTTARAKKGLKNLISLSPTTTRRIKNGQEEIMPADKIKVGDIIRVLSGETIAVDGIIVGGNTSVDQSVMTGESLPVDKTVGDEIYCGTMNCFGSVDVRATRVGEDSSLQRLISLVKQAEENKAPMARTADRWASLLVPAALLIAILTGIITRDIVRAVTVLVVFCPCALVLATPTAIMAAIGQATKHGVIIKSGEALEKMSRADTVAFDKTGTLTMGTLSVSDVVPFNTNVDTLLSLTASAELKSEHPLGKAITEYAHQNKINITEPQEFKMLTGKGVCAAVNGKNVLCGSEQFITQNKISINSQMSKLLDVLRSQGKATVISVYDGDILGVIALTDTLRTDTKDIINRLSILNTDTVLLTGDNILTAEFFANQVGIKNIYAQLLPDGKVEKISEMQKNAKTVCMVGDGVNDAPALKTADIGIAMGNVGSDIAVDAADIALINDDISKLPYLKRLANATVNTIKFSIFLSLFINIAAVILSVLGLLNPTTGALVHNLGSCFVILIAALLYDRKF